MFQKRLIETVAMHKISLAYEYIVLGNLLYTMFYKEHALLCYHITLVHSYLTLSLNFDQKITTKKWDKVRKLITLSVFTIKLKFKEFF